MTKFRGAARARPDRFEDAARALGVIPDVLDRLDVGIDEHGRNGEVVTFWPMRTGAGKFVGIRIRTPDGVKRSVRGSRTALFVPRGLDGRERVLLTEGPTDTAAALSLGLAAVGRPSCRGGADHVLELVRRASTCCCVVVVDQDQPGIEGGVVLARSLRAAVAEVRIIRPPQDHNDLRAWVLSGATREDVEAAIQAAVVVPEREGVHS